MCEIANALCNVFDTGGFHQRKLSRTTGDSRLTFDVLSLRGRIVYMQYMQSSVFVYCINHTASIDFIRNASRGGDEHVVSMLHVG